MTTKKTWFKQLWPWLLILGPAVVIIAGCYTIWLAISHDDAMVVDDYYKQGKAINRDLRRLRHASELGVTLQLTYSASTNVLSGNVQSLAAPMATHLLLQLTHPTRPEKDIRLPVQVDVKGNFAIALPSLERARWQVQLENDKRDWRLAGVWSWPRQPSVVIKNEISPKSQLPQPLSFSSGPRPITESPAYQHATNPAS